MNGIRITVISLPWKPSHQYDDFQFTHLPGTAQKITGQYLIPPDVLLPLLLDSGVAAKNDRNVLFTLVLSTDITHLVSSSRTASGDGELLLLHAVKYGVKFPVA